MNWHAVVASLVLVAPAVAQTPQSLASLKGNTVTLRACVQQGTHGSVATLRQVEVVKPAGAIESPRVMYWFARNLDDFRTNTGNEVEIIGTISDVLTEPIELKATDGVFAEVHTPAGGRTASSAPGVQAVGTAGTAANAPDAASSPDVDDLPATVVKADVTKMRMVGHCR
jgi:hypothetical protein